MREFLCQSQFHIIITQLDDDDDDDDLYMISLIDRYAARPDILEHLCLAEFAANYDVKDGEKENDDDIIPNQLDVEKGDNQSNTIILKKG